jgi:cold-inducible RNA-binding protein
VKRSLTLVDGPVFRNRYRKVPLWASERREESLNIYVGNLSFDTSERELEAAFAAYGSVTSARIATDRDTNRPRGFGFVEMGNQTEAEAAIAALNGRELQGRTLTVNEARPREERGAGGGGNRRGGGYGGGGGNRW